MTRPTEVQITKLREQAEAAEEIAKAAQNLAATLRRMLGDEPARCGGCGGAQRYELMCPRCCGLDEVRP